MCESQFAVWKYEFDFVHIINQLHFSVVCPFKRMTERRFCDHISDTKIKVSSNASLPIVAAKNT